MKTYRRLQVFIASFCVFYVVLGVFGKIVLSPPRELFPVFTWCLFCRVPHERRDYALRILAISGKKLAHTPYFQDAGQWFKEAHSISAYYSIQKLGAAVSQGSVDNIVDIRRFVESLYILTENSVHYEVVERSFNPIERWKYGEFKAVRSLRAFESTEKGK